ncbi:MAG: response regulator [Bdellovibrionaceae bacterium]|nr:response regulator [Pseudobdellovibrionaceae bacterium]
MNQENVPLLNDCELPLELVDVTSKLDMRSARGPNFQLENVALKRISCSLVEPKNNILKHLTDIILEVCQADSAGICIADKNGKDDVFRWCAVSGQLEKFVQDTMPRDFSPCGIVVERRAAILLEKPIRHWPYIAGLGMPLYELLLTPFYREGKAVGTIWVVSHRADKIFDMEDKRILTSIAEIATVIVDTHTRIKNMDSEQFQLANELDQAHQDHKLLSAERDNSLGQQYWLRQAIDHIPKPIFFLNLETQEMWLTNKAAQDMLGFRYEDELQSAPKNGRIVVTTVDGRKIEVNELPSRRVLRGETIHGEEFILFTVKGRFHLKVFAEQIPATHGQPRTALIIFQDISALKAAENELKKTQSELNETAEIAQVGFWSLDIATNKVSVTPILMKQFDFEETQFSGDLHEAINQIVPEDRPDVTAAINQAVSTNEPYQVEYRVKHRNGQIHWLQAKGAVIYDETGVPSRFAGTTIDVTEAVESRHEIESARRLAEMANQTKSQFLANMSHEIRTPLGAIMGFSDLARQPEASKEEIVSYLNIIDRNSIQVLRIIDDILDLAKVEAGRVDVESIAVSLTEFIADFSSLLGFRARENGIAFVIQAQTDLPNLICTDPTRLRQILTNAVGNAIKFTAKGKVTMYICYNDGTLAFGIEDTGRGISQEQAKGLFQAFVQADASTTRKFGGTGLGLVLTKRLCQLLGGDYVLERSELNVGSKFNASIKVVLPKNTQIISKDKVSFTNFDQPVHAFTKGKLADIKVLLVEDSPDNQVLIRLILERQGVQLEVAGDGYAGVEKALNNEYDVVLMDIQMPHMDGHEAVKTLRAKGYRKPIIALTAHAMKEESERAKTSGFTDFLSKPIQREVLIKMISERAKVTDQK